MISVIMPTLNAEDGLAASLESLRPGQESGLVAEILVVDGGSSDSTISIIRSSDARILTSPPGRAPQMHEGALQASGEWLLFLHADVILETGWEIEAGDFLARHGRNCEIAAAFGFSLRDCSWKARLLEQIVAWRCRWFGLAYGDQGLLIPRYFYLSLGGFAMLPLMEDVEMARRIGRARLALLRCKAKSDAHRYRSDGFLARTTRNALLLVLYLLGTAPERLAQFYSTRANQRNQKHRTS